MPRLLINVDHVATLRNARREAFPDPVDAARACEAGGADGIVFHLREDRRHITDADVRASSAAVTTKLDFELSMAPEIVGICLATRPHLATLVPERREEVTTEGGLDVTRPRRRLAGARAALLRGGHRRRWPSSSTPSRRTSPPPPPWGPTPSSCTRATSPTPRRAEARAAVLERLAAAARQAHGLGLRVHAGHGLDYDNVGAFFAAVPHVAEVSIGFALIARALFVGLRGRRRDGGPSTRPTPDRACTPVMGAPGPILLLSSSLSTLWKTPPRRFCRARRPQKRLRGHRRPPNAGKSR